MALEPCLDHAVGHDRRVAPRAHADLGGCLKGIDVSRVVRLDVIDRERRIGRAKIGVELYRRFEELAFVSKAASCDFPVLPCSRQPQL